MHTQQPHPYPHIHTHTHTHTYTHTYTHIHTHIHTPTHTHTYTHTLKQSNNVVCGTYFMSMLTVFNSLKVVPFVDGDVVLEGGDSILYII